MEPYLASSMHVAGFVTAMKRQGFLDKVLPLIAPQTRHAIDHPYEEKWVSAHVIQDLSNCLVDAHGPDALAEVNYAMTTDSLGKLVLPMLRVALAITGRSPATIFARLGDSIKVAMKGVTVSWAPEGANAGRVTLRYPEAVPTVVHHAWRGVFRFAFDLTERQGQLVAQRYLDEGKTLELDVSWK